MNSHIEHVLDEILENLNCLIKAETEAAVRSLHLKIEDAIQQAGKELKGTYLPRETRPKESKEG